MADTPVEEAIIEESQRSTLRRLLLVAWALMTAVAVAIAVSEPGPGTVALPALFVVAFALSEANRRMSAGFRHRGLRELELRLDNTTYTNESKDLPNRNYLLDQLRREMPRARGSGTPFVLVLVKMEDPAALAERRGPDFAERTLRSLARTVELCTRVSDFSAELGPGNYGILLYDCNEEMARSYLSRLPGTIAVSTGTQMLEVPLEVRLSEYDLQSLYAIDVLREAEEAEPARAAEKMRFGADAA